MSKTKKILYTIGGLLFGLVFLYLSYVMSGLNKIFIISSIVGLLLSVTLIIFSQIQRNQKVKKNKTKDKEIGISLLVIIGLVLVIKFVEHNYQDFILENLLPILLPCISVLFIISSSFAFFLIITNQDGMKSN